MMFVQFSKYTIKLLIHQPIWYDTGGRYLSPLSMISGVWSSTMCMEEHLLEEVNPLNGSQYLERLISTIARGGSPGSQKKILLIINEFGNHDIGVKHLPASPITNLYRKTWLTIFNGISPSIYIFSSTKLKLEILLKKSEHNPTRTNIILVYIIIN